MATRAIGLLVTAVLACATAHAEPQCAQCGHAASPYAGGVHYPKCAASCRGCQGRSHGRYQLSKRYRSKKSSGMPAIARFHPVPTRPVFEPRHALPRPKLIVPPPPVDREIRKPMPEPASVLESMVPSASDSAPQTIKLEAPTTVDVDQVTTGETTIRTSYHAKPTARAKRPFAWFFRPGLD